MYIITTGMSCGVHLICDINDSSPDEWENAFKRSLEDDDIDGPKGYWFLFSDNENGHGEEFAKFVKEKKWGNPRPLSKRRTENPNSGNMIKTWAFRFTGALEPKKKKEKTPFHLVLGTSI